MAGILLAVPNFQPNAAEQSWHPATFPDRGVAVPFTTPALAGARVRKAPRGVELVTPHPAGGRGVYILAWAEVAASCAPTWHDALLIERIAALPALGPRDIARAARAVALEGAAGHKAREAAQAARARDLRLALQTTALLVRMLVAQTGGGDCSSDDLDRRGRDAIRHLAEAWRHPAAAIGNDMETVSGHYTAIGLDRVTEAAGCRRTLAALDRLCARLAAWTGAGPGAGDPTAIAVLAGAELVRTLARRALAEALAMATELPVLLRALAGGPPAAENATRDLTRVEWLLDGWEAICMVWDLSAEAGQPRAGLAEMALMMPVLPQDAEAWAAIVADPGTRGRPLRSTAGLADWRAGSAVFALIARNEHIRALAA